MTTLPVFQSIDLNQQPSFMGHQKRKAFADITNESRVNSSRNINDKKINHVLPVKRGSTASFSVLECLGADNATVNNSNNNINNNSIVSSNNNNDASNYYQTTTATLQRGSTTAPFSVLEIPGRQGSSKKSYQPKTSLQQKSVLLRYTSNGKVDNIDERDKEDPLSVSEYAQDIYAHFKIQEQATGTRVPPRYLSLQPQINEKMRSILVDWLVGAQVQFKLGPETLYLAVNIVDRYCSLVRVERCKLQLVGATSLFIAAKYEETYRYVGARDIVALCDNLYPKHEVVQMETHILSALGFKISVPTAQSFLLRYLKAGHADENMALLACYILEGTLLSYPLLEYLPSQLASASVLLARNATGRNPWSPTLQKYAEYREEEIIPIANILLEHKEVASLNFTTVDKKYSSRRFGRVAKTELSRVW